MYAERVGGSPWSNMPQVLKVPGTINVGRSESFYTLGQYQVPRGWVFELIHNFPIVLGTLVDEFVASNYFIFDLIAIF